MWLISPRLARSRKTFSSVGVAVMRVCSSPGGRTAPGYARDRAISRFRLNRKWPLGTEFFPRCFPFGLWYFQKLWNVFPASKLVEEDDIILKAQIARFNCHRPLFQSSSQS